MSTSLSTSSRTHARSRSRYTTGIHCIDRRRLHIDVVMILDPLHLFGRTGVLEGCTRESSAGYMQVMPRLSLVILIGRLEEGPSTLVKLRPWEICKSEWRLQENK